MTPPSLIKIFILKSLRAMGDSPMPDDVLRLAIGNAFRHDAFTAGDLGQLIAECERSGWIAGTRDELTGVQWALTPKGRIQVQQLAG